VAEARPDVIHVHGLRYAPSAAGLARRLGTPVLVQDHADHPPRSPLRRALLGWALRRVAGVSFSAAELAQPWREAGLIAPDQPVFSLMESSSRFCLQPQREARARTGLTGGPLCLWVGRLNANKDPVAVLDGFAAALRHLPEARLVMAYGACDLLPQVRRWLSRNPREAEHVTLAGTLPHASLEAIYNSADLFLLGSHHEGSGYAVLEALSCGVAPVVTDIPSFRRLLGGGEIGGLWPVGDSEALTEALLRTWAGRRPDTRRRIRTSFDERWSFEAIGRDALTVYRTILEKHTV
jgi:glycosyltransferase involved in cell wall biosynthesis